MIETRPAASRENLWAALILLGGVALRALYLATPKLDADMAMWGVQALGLLDGRVSFLFGGELVGGNLEAWLAAPLFAVLGASPLTLCLVPAALGLAFALAAWRLARREWGPAAGLAALAWVSWPPFYLAWHSVLPRGAYIEVPLLAVIAFALTLDLARGRDGGAWRAFALGLVCGLGLWCHLLMAPVVAACALYLLAERPGLYWSPRLPLALAGLALGALPLLLISLPGGLFTPDVLYEGRSPDLAGGLVALVGRGLPYLLGWPDEAGGGPAPRLTVLAVYLAILAAPALVWRRGLLPRAQGPGALMRLVLVYLACYLAVWLASGAHGQGTWRHLTPLYAGLPFLAGAAVAALEQVWGRRGLWAAAGLTALLVAGNLAGNLYLAPLLDPGEMAQRRAQTAADRAVLARLEAAGHGAVYGEEFWFSLPLTLESGGRVLVADQLLNHLPWLTRAADAAARPAYLALGKGVDLGRLLTFLGVRARRERVGPYYVYDSFALAAPAETPVPREGWSSPQPGAADAWDRDLATRWTTFHPRRKDDRLLVDLGRVVEGVCRLDLYPGAFVDAADGLVVRTSLDGKRWETAAAQGTGLPPMFWSVDRPLSRSLPARGQVRFVPRPARYLELTNTVTSSVWWWSVAELYVYRDDGPAPSPAAPGELAAAAAALGGRGSVYAPPEVLALLPPGRAGFQLPCLPKGNQFQARELILGLEDDPLLVLPAADWPAAAALLATRLAGPPRVARLGGWVLAHGLIPAPPDGIAVPLPPETRLGGSPTGQPLAAARDGDPATRWHTGRPQAPGQELVLDLGRETDLTGVWLEVGKWTADQPRGLAVEVWRDGAWRAVPGLWLDRGPLAWAGQRLVVLGGGRLAARFPRLSAARLRLTQTGAHGTFYWSVAEMGIFTPAAAPAR